MDNKFQDKLGMLDWQFKVEELPIEKDDPAPVTGNRGNMTVWMAALIAALAGVSVCIVFATKKKKSEN